MAVAFDRSLPLWQFQMVSPSSWKLQPARPERRRKNSDHLEWLGIIISNIKFKSFFGFNSFLARPALRQKAGG
jgi:hypothetical protein